MKAGGDLTPQDVRDIAAYIARHREGDGPFDLVISGATPGDDPAAGARIVAPFEAAGATWWIEGINPWRFGWTGDGPWLADAMYARVRQGPPRVRRTGASATNAG